MVERRSPKPYVEGSSPSAPAIKSAWKAIPSVFLFYSSFIIVSLFPLLGTFFRIVCRQSVVRSYTVDRQLHPICASIEIAPRNLIYRYRGNFNFCVQNIRIHFEKCLSICMSASGHAAFGECTLASLGAMSTAGFQNFGFPEPSRGFPNCFRADRLSCRFCGTRFRSDSPRSGAYPPVKTIRKSAA